ncbi:MAG: glycosyltransferase family 4 protein [Acidobacteria bacterium]|nr:glycosyltransferase family 4 protein [Acidobacteriota bacterium]
MSDPCGPPRGQRDTRRRVALVVQRYGTDVTGGSESLARAVAERLAVEFRVTVFTTCARDYVTWRNEAKEGTERINGVDVARFRTEEERDLDAFNAFSESLYGRPHSDEEELIWLKRQGPYAPRLVAQLEACKDRFEAILFFTYLYFPTYWGLKAAPERSILVPTAHDEPPLRFRIYEDVFSLPRALAFCSAPEEELVRERFRLRGGPTVVAGIGVETPEAPDVEGFRARHAVTGPYVLYAGRIDAGKGCAEMLEHFERYRRSRRGGADLLLIGRLAMPEPRNPGVRYLGYLPEDEKHAAMAGARAVLCPSPYESLSIVLLEGLSLGTPVLVSARSPVLEDHCIRSNAGLYYGDADEFVEALDLLVREPALRAALGENGRRYVRESYRWEAVLSRYKGLIEAVSRGRREAARPR